MDPKNNERPPMVHRETPSGNSNKDYSRRPMAKPKESFRHKTAVLLAKIGLVGLGATVVAGGVHHVTDVDVGVASDTIQSGAMDELVKLSISSGPQQEQKDLNREKAAVEALFRPIGFQEDGEIEIDVAKLPETAMTQAIMVAKRNGTAYDRIDVNGMVAIDNVPVGPNSRIAVDSPTIYVASEGPDMYFQATIETKTGPLTVLIPGSSVTETRPGIFKPINAVTETTPLDVARLLHPTPTQ